MQSRRAGAHALQAGAPRPHNNQIGAPSSASPLLTLRPSPPPPPPPGGFQAFSERVQWLCGAPEQPGPGGHQLQHPGRRQRQLPLQVRPDAVRRWVRGVVTPIRPQVGGGRPPETQSQGQVETERDCGTGMRQGAGDRKLRRRGSTKERWREKCRSGQEKGTRSVRDRQTQKGRDSDHQREDPGLRETHSVTGKHGDHQREKEIAPGC